MKSKDFVTITLFKSYQYPLGVLSKECNIPIEGCKLAVNDFIIEMQEKDRNDISQISDTFFDGIKVDNGKQTRKEIGFSDALFRRERLSHKFTFELYQKINGEIQPDHYVPDDKIYSNETAFMVILPNGKRLKKDYERKYYDLYMFILSVFDDYYQAEVNQINTRTIRNGTGGPSRSVREALDRAGMRIDPLVSIPSSFLLNDEEDVEEEDSERDFDDDDDL